MALTPCAPSTVPLSSKWDRPPANTAAAACLSGKKYNKREDFDHKYVVVEISRDISDLSELTETEMDELKKLYPRISEGEGWFGKEVAEYCMKNYEKSL